MKKVNVSSPEAMYESFMEIFPDWKKRCKGFKQFSWGDRVRKILIDLTDTTTQILFGARKEEEDDGEVWTAFSTLLVP